MFPLYLQYLLIDFRQTFVIGASWDTDDLITFLGQKVKLHSTLLSSATFSSFLVQASHYGPQVMSMRAAGLHVWDRWAKDCKLYILYILYEWLKIGLLSLLVCIV